MEVILSGIPDLMVMDQMRGTTLLFTAKQMVNGKLFEIWVPVPNQLKKSTFPVFKGYI